MDLLIFLNKAKKSLFRYEGLQKYSIEEEKQDFENYLKTERFTESSMDEWVKFTLSKKRQNVSMQRVRLVKLPLTNYTRYELEAYKVSSKAEEEIRIIKEKATPLPENDFWLIDGSQVLIMKYTKNGQYLGFNVSNKVNQYLSYKKILLKNSIPLKEFLHS